MWWPPKYECIYVSVVCLSQTTFITPSWSKSVTAAPREGGGTEVWTAAADYMRQAWWEGGKSISAAHTIKLPHQTANTVHYCTIEVQKRHTESVSWVTLWRLRNAIISTLNCAFCESLLSALPSTYWYLEREKCRYMFLSAAKKAAHVRSHTFFHFLFPKNKY